MNQEQTTPKAYPVYRVSVRKAYPGWWIWEINSQSLPCPIVGNDKTRAAAIKRAGLIAARIHRQ